ncbi:Abi-alpha family protein [Rhizobium sp. X9]|uniref:Abi-alpha family protein n=1 Tax=Rhizobium sp. X9 TaxID=2815360 RepID=UPI001C0CB2EE|nr:Abi-alpha family protein [Rhizobium sp. X9]
MTTDIGLPVKFDVGVSAKAELSAQIKTEIPAEASGHFVEMVTDIFRPFSEARGLKADQIRLQREDVLFEIAQRANKRLELLKPKVPLELKFLVPFLEKASYESTKSSLVDWWAGLLAGAMSDKDAQHPLYIDFLSKMTPAEADLLNRLWGDVSSFIGAAFSARDFVMGIIIDAVGETSASTERYEAAIRQGVSNLLESAPSRGVVISRFSFPSVSDDNIFVSSSIDVVTLEKCVSIGVLRKDDTTFTVLAPFIGEYRCSAEFYSFSQVGRSLMQACHRG